MQDAIQLHCKTCEEPITLKRAEYNDQLFAGCDCKEIDVRVSIATPETWEYE